MADLGNVDELVEDPEFLAYSARAEGTNISPQTLLATDYLNHFNEIVMMLEMIPDIPECFDEARAWQPKTYQQHFRDSQFRDKELAIDAYEHVPPRYRQPFDEVVGQMNLLVAMALDRIGEALAEQRAEVIRLLCSDSSLALQKMIDIASAIIHGSTRRLDQAEIDGFLAR